MADVQDVLATRVPGLMIMPTQGNVGTGAIVRIRGVSSLFLPNDPLVYVDGVRVDNNPRAGPLIRGGYNVSRLADIDPEDIETIEVIKGPAAATLYGTEASRGVIQILTRRGVPGPTRFGLTVRQGANWFRNPAGRLNQVFARNASTGQIDSVNLYQREIDAGRPPIFSTGQPRAYALNMSGGTPVIRFMPPVSTTAMRGRLLRLAEPRLRSANLSVLPSDKLDIETSVALVRNHMRLGGMSLLDAGWDAMTQIQFGKPRTLNPDPLRGFLQSHARGHHGNRGALPDRSRHGERAGPASPLDLVFRAADGGDGRGQRNELDPLPERRHPPVRGPERGRQVGGWPARGPDLLRLCRAAPRRASGEI